VGFIKGGLGGFEGWAALPGVQALTGDFNGDGRTDVALLRRTAGWGSMPVAFANGDGSWRITNGGIGEFAVWAQGLKVQALTGDFNGDKRMDVALLNQAAGWGSMPVAFANGDGSWRITNSGIGDFAGWAATRNGDHIDPLTGDFNGDGRTDVALLNRYPGWGSMPLALANGDGSWQITNKGIGDFAGWATATDLDPSASKFFTLPSATVLTGDFDGDKRMDVALLNQAAGWKSMPVAFWRAATITAAPPIPTIISTITPTPISISQVVDPITGLTAAITAADADSILLDASNLLQSKDSANDVACLVTFRRPVAIARVNGPITINSQAQQDQVFALPGLVKVVDDINFCGVLRPNLVGCGITTPSIMVVRMIANQEGFLWAHEYGHTKGLGHRTDTSAAVMFATVGGREVNATECAAFQR
jgi:hypothetical protein